MKHERLACETAHDKQGRCEMMHLLRQNSLTMLSSHLQNAQLVAKTLRDLEVLTN